MAYCMAEYTDGAANLYRPAPDYYCKYLVPPFFSHMAPASGHLLLHHRVLLRNLDPAGGTIQVGMAITEDNGQGWCHVRLPLFESVSRPANQQAIIIELSPILCKSDDLLDIYLRSDNPNDDEVDLKVQQICLLQVNAGAVSEDTSAADAVADNIDNLDAPVSSRATPADVQVTVQPLAGQVLAGQATSPITAYKYARLQAQITVLDNNGNPVDLSGKQIAFVAYSDRDPDTKVLELKNYDGEDTLSIGGTDNNIVTLDGPDSVIPTPGTYRWVLRNQTDDTVLLAGTLRVKAAADATAT